MVTYLIDESPPCGTDQPHPQMRRGASDVRNRVPNEPLQTVPAAPAWESRGGKVQNCQPISQAHSCMRAVIASIVFRPDFA